MNVIQKKLIKNKFIFTSQCLIFRVFFFHVKNVQKSYIHFYRYESEYPVENVAQIYAVSSKQRPFRIVLLKKLL